MYLRDSDAAIVKANGRAALSLPPATRPVLTEQSRELANPAGSRDRLDLADGAKDLEASLTQTRSPRTRDSRANVKSRGPNSARRTIVPGFGSFACVLSLRIEIRGLPSQPRDCRSLLPDRDPEERLIAAMIAVAARRREPLLPVEARPSALTRALGSPAASAPVAPGPQGIVVMGTTWPCCDRH
jgi:hypothetical protein